MLNQPINKLAPFEVLDDNGVPIIQVDERGVLVDVIIFPDGSTQSSAAVSSTDSGTF